MSLSTKQQFRQNATPASIAKPNPAVVWKEPEESPAFQDTKIFFRGLWADVHYHKDKIAWVGVPVVIFIATMVARHYL